MITDLNEVFTAISKKTGKPYIDDEKKGHIFTSPKSANKFKEETKDEIEIDGPKYVDFEILSASMYQAGAASICVHNENKTEDEKISAPKKKYYNPETNFALDRLKETRRKKYLRMLKNATFLVPCEIKNGIEIYFAVAKAEENEFILAFTDLDEYQLWEEGKNYEPLMLTSGEIKQIAKERNVIVNITGNRYVITPEKFQKMNKKEMETHE